jgi:predicted nucleotide-binding protein
MACMPIEIVPLGEISQALLEEAINEANSRQSQFVYSLMTAPDSEHFKVFAFNDIYAPDFLNRMSTTRDEIRGYHPYIIAFVDGELSGERLSNLFASDRPKVGLAVSTIANVPDLIVPADKLSAYFLHRLAKQTLSFLAPDRKNHDDTRGCVYDLKINKLDLLRSMKARAFCDECRGALLSGKLALSAAQLTAIDALFAASGKLLEDRRASSTPVRRPRVFIGSSNEGLRVANAVQSLMHHEFLVEVWNQGTIFGLGNATLEDLESAVMTYDFGIFVFTPDDQVESRGKVRTVARDNVLFEFGLFVGKLTRKRAYLVRSPEVSLPSDLAGINTAAYDPTAPNLTAALGPACQGIRGAIEQATRGRQ